MAAAPLVDGDQLIVLVGGETGIVACMDKMTGDVRWRNVRDRQPGYCPPMIFTFGDTRQLVIWHPSAVTSLDPRSGKTIWRVPFRVRQFISIATPRKFANRLFVTAETAALSSIPRRMDMIKKTTNNSSNVNPELPRMVRLTPIFVPMFPIYYNRRACLLVIGAAK